MLRKTNRIKNLSLWLIGVGLGLMLMVTSYVDQAKSVESFEKVEVDNVDRQPRPVRLMIEKVGMDLVIERGRVVDNDWQISDVGASWWNQSARPEAQFCGKCGEKLIMSKLSQEKNEMVKIGFFEQYIETLKNLGDFQGRSSRREYWTFYIINFVIAFILAFFEGEEGSWSGLLYLITLLPSLAVGIRRMHDIGRSGWWLLFPIVNLIFSLTPGEEEKNEYGLRPVI